MEQNSSNNTPKIVESEKNLKSNTAEVERRVKVVLESLSNGVTTSDIRAMCSADWDISERQVDNYIAKAKDKILEIARQDNELVLGIIVKELWTIQRDARIDGNLREARAALKNIAELKGLKQLTINHVVNVPARLETMSDADLDKILEADFEVKGDDEDED